MVGCEPLPSPDVRCYVLEEYSIRMANSRSAMGVEDCTDIGCTWKEERCANVGLLADLAGSEITG